jgi:ribosome-associated protein
MASKRSKRSEPKIVADEAELNRDYLEAEPEKETRGEKKRKAIQLERLGESLVNLSADKLARVPMPDDLRAAVDEARRIASKTSARGGYRRQINFIGRIMRTLDAEPIAASLEQMRVEDAPSAAAFREAERWRDRLVSEGDAALEELVVTHPAVDRTKLRQLMRARSIRAIFKELHASFKASTSASP